MKNDYADQLGTQDNGLEQNLKTEVTDVKPEYWTGKIHRADGSIMNVEVGNVEYLLEQCNTIKSTK